MLIIGRIFKELRPAPAMSHYDKAHCGRVNQSLHPSTAILRFVARRSVEVVAGDMTWRLCPVPSMPIAQHELGEKIPR
jgi:hypothetical protein